MTDQKKTELTDYFYPIWTKIHNFRKIFDNGSYAPPPPPPPNSSQTRNLETFIRNKNSEKGPSTFLSINSRKGQYRDCTVAHPSAKLS